MTRGLVAFAGAGLAAAVALRAWVLTSPLGGLDADEAVWGLMALRATEGEVDVFFWGQNYAGTHEVLLDVPVVAALGASTATARAVPIALFAVAVFLVWRVGRRLLGEPGATAAAVFAAIWPAYVVWKSTRAHGVYGSGTVCALLLLLLALRLREAPSRRDAAALGLVAGLGWWATPQLAFVAVPVLAWLAVVERRRLRALWPAVPAALLGAAPWLVWNVLHPLRSLEAPFGAGSDSYLDHVRTFLLATFPTVLGVRVPFTLDWLPAEAVGRVAEAVVLLLAAVLAARGGDRAVLGVIVLAYPVLQSFSPFASLNDEPRYLVLLAPFLALTLAAFTARRLVPAVLTAAALCGLSVVALRTMADVEPPVPPVGGVRVPADLGPVLETLDRYGQRRVRAPYEAAYRIAFESGERIVAASTGQVRYPPYQAVVARAAGPAYVFVRGSAAERRHAPSADDYRRIAVDGWVVYVAR